MLHNYLPAPLSFRPDPSPSMSFVHSVQLMTFALDKLKQ